MLCKDNSGVSTEACVWGVARQHCPAVTTLGLTLHSCLQDDHDKVLPAEALRRPCSAGPAKGERCACKLHGLHARKEQAADKVDYYCLGEPGSTGACGTLDLSTALIRTPIPLLITSCACSPVISVTVFPEGHLKV
jgi:hypothetical protein